MSIYQFLIAVRQDGSQLMNEEGETTRYIKKTYSSKPNLSSGAINSLSLSFIPTANKIVKSYTIPFTSCYLNWSLKN